MDKKVLINHIVCIDENGGIGWNGGLLYSTPVDLKHFAEVTMGSPIIMGRKTFESLPNGPLKGRLNIVISKTMKSGEYDGFIVVDSIPNAIQLGKDRTETNNIFIIGGSEVYKETFSYADKIYLSKIHNRFEQVDVYYNYPIDSRFKEIKTRTVKDGNYFLTFEEYVRR